MNAIDDSSTTYPCKTSIQTLLAWLNDSKLHDQETFAERLDLMCLFCQPLVEQGLLEIDDFECIRVRHRRLQRLLELQAPLQIVENEFKWMKRMTEILLDVIAGQEPNFSKEELEELRWQSEIDSAFENEPNEGHCAKQGTKPG